MTEQKRNFSNYQQVAPADLMAMQNYVETSVDDIVLDTIVKGRGYSGFAMSKTGPSQITIQPGRLYVYGKVYALNTPTQIDYTASLPAVNNRIVSIGVYGTEADENPIPVNFLSPAESTPQNPVYRPQTIATTHDRNASTSQIIGAENPNPSIPTLDTTVLQIGTITLSPTGILSFANNLENQVPNLEDVEGRVVSIEAFDAIVGPQVASLASDLARLANAGLDSLFSRLVGNMLVRIADLDSKVGIPANASNSESDYFLDAAGSDLTNVLFSAKVMEGIRFPDAAANDTALVQFNPLDPNAMVRNGVLFPAFDSVYRFFTGRAIGEIQIAAYTYTVQAYMLQSMSRTRTRYGTAFDVCTNSAFWQSGKYDPLTSIFTLPNGETFLAAYDFTVGGTIPNEGEVGYVGANGLVFLHAPVRLQEFWVDTVTTTYWGYAATTGTLTGFSIAESFLNGSDFWLDSIYLYLSRLDATGSITVSICETTEAGAPMMSAQIAQATVAFANLRTGNAGTRFQFTPTLLSAGKRYAVVVTTTANHYAMYATGSDFPQGTFYELSAGGFAQGDLSKHLCFAMFSCKFRSPVVSLQFQNLQLSGGMTDIDIISGAITPKSTKAVYEIQIAGVWHPLSATSIGLLNSGGSLNPNVPLRVTMAGTPDMMPCIDLLHSNVHVSRPALSFNHISEARLASGGTTSITVIERYESINASYNAALVKLLTGAGYTTVVNPTSVTNVTTADGAIERTHLFTLGSSVTSYKIQSSGTTTTALEVFLVANRRDYYL